MERYATVFTRHAQGEKKVGKPIVTFVILAQPGWFAVGLCVGSDLKPIRETSKIPIVAWKIFDNDWVEPISFDIIFPQDHYILSSKGRVYEPSGFSWENIDSFIDARMAANN